MPENCRIDYGFVVGESQLSEIEKVIDDFHTDDMDFAYNGRHFYSVADTAFENYFIHCSDSPFISVCDGGWEPTKLIDYVKLISKENKKPVDKRIKMPIM